MIEKVSGIVLSITRHNERHNVVTLFTRQRGRVPMLSPLGTGKSGKLRNSRLQPLAVLETDINFKQNAELQKLGSFSLSYVWTGIYFHPVKGMVALFLSEFLTRLLRASMPDESLYDFIIDSLRLLDGMETGIADFHIAFMASLLPFMGIQPDVSEWQPGRVFDLRSGVFTDLRPPHTDYLMNEDAKVMADICSINFGNVREYATDNERRRMLLERILRYYEIHYPGTSSLKSLEVLREVRV